ncbi:MAG: lipase maturation factor family protein, partial [Acidobacteriota bacterium]
MTVSAPPSKPLLIFDGECTFCRLWIERWRAHTLDAVDYAESRQVAGHFREIPVEIYDRTVVLVLPDGSVRTGAEAVLRSRAMGRRGTWILALYEKAAWFRATAETLYRFVAEHRQAASRWTRLLWGTHPAPPTYARSSALYLRLLGAVYLLAFVSLWLQIDGLIGNRGILPFASYLDAARAQLGLARFWRIPTLAWISPDDTFLHLLCAAGVLSSLLVSLGLVPLLGLGLCWALYLSLATVSGTFLNFQWDYLLLEAGFLSIFMAPLSWRTGAGRNVPPGRLARSLVSWLVFRLMLGSGIVKLSSGDPTWWHLR